MSRTSLVAALGITAALALPTTHAYAASPSGMLSLQDMKAMDKQIQERVEYRLEVNDLVGHYDIKVKVEGSQVWLSGDVRTAAQKTEAGRVAKVDGVTSVTNDIKINPDVDKSIMERTKKGLNKAGVAIDDAWIAAKIHWFFVGEDLLKDSDIKVDTAKGVVTLRGTVKTQAGRLRAVHLAQRTDGAKRVIDQLTIGKKQ